MPASTFDAPPRHRLMLAPLFRVAPPLVSSAVPRRPPPIFIIVDDLIRQQTQLFSRGSPSTLLLLSLFFCQTHGLVKTVHCCYDCRLVKTVSLVRQSRESRLVGGVASQIAARTTSSLSFVARASSLVLKDGLVSLDAGRLPGRILLTIIIISALAMHHRRQPHV